MNKSRIKTLTKFKTKPGPILYWMSRDQRVSNNWALLHSQIKALKNKQPLIVLFCLTSNFLDASSYMYKFMLEGLKLVDARLKELNIPFILIKGNPSDIIPNFIRENKVSNLITDFSPLRIKREWIDDIKKKIEISFDEVDAHNIVPVWGASPKLEYAAYTLRPKIQKLLNLYLEDIQELKVHPYEWPEYHEEINWRRVLEPFNTKSNNEIIYDKISGEKEANSVLKNFINNKLRNYSSDRNNPLKDATSNLSPYLHFGQISSQKVVLETMKNLNLSSLKGTFYDEIIVRKELSDNFCYYNLNYDNYKGFPVWAQKTLNSHRRDIREYIYNLNEFESAKTHDDVWNAAQNQMILTGKMHGYLRMYWCKKILEWTESPEEAIKIAIYLNDKYELDGRDPNGYTGIAWSIGGVHDRAWKERSIFGKLRYMSYDGLKRKFNINQYIEKIGRLKERVANK